MGVPIGNFVNAIGMNKPGLARVVTVGPVPSADGRVYNELTYDSNVFIGATPPTELTFFTTTQGQADYSGYIRSKTQGDTSLTQVGQIGQNYSKNVTGLTIQIRPVTGDAGPPVSLTTTSWAPTQLHWQSLFQRAYLEFSVSTVNYLTAPLDTIPSTLGQFAMGTTAAGTSSYNVMGNGWYGQRWELAGEGIIVQGAENFKFKITWPQAPTSGISATQGYLIRVDLHGPIAKPM